MVARKVQSYWRTEGLRHEQHGFRVGHSTDEPILSLVNNLETAKDFGSQLFIGSWDWKRAFDSIPKQLLIWSWVRLGVPSDIAEYMVAIDMGGVTVVRSPLAQEVLMKGGRDDLQRLGLGFEAERGAGQGDVLSPANWSAVYDILISMLADSTEEADVFYTQDIRGYARPSSRMAFADDFLSAAGTHEGLQKEANVVSAFALFSTMVISTAKLRASRVMWGTASHPGDDSFVVHGPGWTPVIVPFTDRPIKNLGVLQSTGGDGYDHYVAALRLVREACSRIGRCELSAEARWDCLYKQVYPQLLYSARFAPWRLSRFREIDGVISSLLRLITRNMRGFPAHLLYLPQSNGGLGFKRFSDLAQERKLKILLRLEWGSSEAKHIASSLIGRSLRGIGVYSTQGHATDLRADSLSDLESPTWWITSLLEWLDEKGLTLRVNGTEWAHESRPIFLVSEDPLPSKEDYQALYSLGISLPGERSAMQLALEGEEDVGPPTNSAFGRARFGWLVEKRAALERAKRWKS